MPTTLSCTVFRVKKLLAVTLCALPLTACDALDIVGPRPNAELIALAQQAFADGQVLDDATLAHTRHTQATQLFNEAERLCGTTEAGEVPTTCAIERGPGEATGNADPSAAAHLAPAALLDAAANVPEDSVTLLVAQAIDLRAGQAEDEEDLDAEALDNEEDLEAARAMLRAEYAAQYGFAMATAYADDATDARLDELREASDARALALREALEPSGDVPEAAPGYDFAGVPAPSDAASAGAYAQSQQQTLIDQWRATAAHAQSDVFRHLAVELAANAQRV